MADDLDPYLIPGTAVLKNRLGITSEASLKQAEADLTRDRLQQLSQNPVQGQFDLAHLRAIHRHIFQDVYDWAGQPRTIAISKGGLFCLPQFIESAGADIFARLARENRLRGLGREAFAGRAAYFFAEINALHPFREGNGRTQNTFLRQLGREAGFEVSLAQVGRGRMIEAARAAHAGKLDLAHAMFLEFTAPLGKENILPPAGGEPAPGGASAEALRTLTALREAHGRAGGDAERAQLTGQAKTLANELAGAGATPTQRTRLRLLAVEAVQGNGGTTPEKVVAQARRAQARGQGRGRG